MIKARQQRLVAGTLNDLMVPMTTDVQERAKRMISVPDDDYGSSCDLAREVVAGFRDLCGAADILPGAAEDVSAFELEDAVVGVPRRRERAALSCALRYRLDIELIHA